MSSRASGNSLLAAGQATEGTRAKPKDLKVEPVAHLGLRVTSPADPEASTSSPLIRLVPAAPGAGGLDATITGRIRRNGSSADRQGLLNVPAEVSPPLALP